jgi:hypothetical protein
MWKTGTIALVQRHFNCQYNWFSEISDSQEVDVLNCRLCLRWRSRCFELQTVSSMKKSMFWIADCVFDEEVDVLNCRLSSIKKSMFWNAGCLRWRSRCFELQTVTSNKNSMFWIADCVFDEEVDVLNCRLCHRTRIRCFELQTVTSISMIDRIKCFAMQFLVNLMHKKPPLATSFSETVSSGKLS